MTRISTTSIKRFVVLGAVLAAAIAPQAAKAEVFYAPDGGFVNIHASCRAFGINVGTVSTSGNYALHRVWARYQYANGSQTGWELRYDWTVVDNWSRPYAPVVNTNTRYVQLYVEVAIWNGRSYNMHGTTLQYSTTNQYWCWT